MSIWHLNKEVLTAITGVWLPVCNHMTGHRQYKSTCSNNAIINLFMDKEADVWMKVSLNNEPKWQHARIMTYWFHYLLSSEVQTAFMSTLCRFQQPASYPTGNNTAEPGDYHVILSHLLCERHNMRSCPAAGNIYSEIRWAAFIRVSEKGGRLRARVVLQQWIKILISVRSAKQQRPTATCRLVVLSI